MDKSGGGSASAQAPKVAPPLTILAAVIALAVAAIAAIVTAIGLYGISDWLTQQIRTSDIKADKKTPTAAHVADQVSAAQRGGLIASLIVLVAVILIGYAVYRGRPWARWAPLGFWVLATFTGQLVGINSILTIGSSAPMAYKLPAFVAGLSFLAAVLLTNLSPSIKFFVRNRPPQPAGAPARRGLFGPRPPAGERGAFGSTRPSRTAATRTAATGTSASRTAATRPATQASTIDRSRSKTRAGDANAAAVAKGADLARSRAKASKSRRTDR